MTEEIIIDGVNVAGCEFFDNGEVKNACSLGYREDVVNNFSPNCDDNPNCYYKQLKRLEQENNSLQAQLNNITVQSNNAITALEQENKELKELNKKICEDWEKEIKVYWNALEEIKKLAETGAVHEDCYSCNEIVEKIDEVIG